MLFILFDEAAPRTAGIAQSYARRELALFKGREMELTEARLFVTFDGPARAIRCARAIADAAARLG